MRLVLIGVLGLTACGSVDFTAVQVATVVTESRGVGFDEFGRGVVGAGDDGLCVFSGPEGMVGEMDVPGSDRVLDMWGAQAIVTGDGSHVAVPDAHQLTDLVLVDAGVPSAARLTLQGVIASIQEGDSCVVTSQSERLATLPGSCQDLAVDRFSGAAWLLVDGQVHAVQGQASVPAAGLFGQHIAFDAGSGDLWVSEGADLTRFSTLDGSLETFELDHEVVDLAAAGASNPGVIAALFTARDSVVHVRPSGSIGMRLTPDRAATGITVNFEGTYLGVEGQQQVELYELVEAGQGRRRVRQALAGGAGGTSWVGYD